MQAMHAIVRRYRVISLLFISEADICQRATWQLSTEESALVTRQFTMLTRTPTYIHNIYTVELSWLQFPTEFLILEKEKFILLRYTKIIVTIR